MTKQPRSIMRVAMVAALCAGCAGDIGVTVAPRAAPPPIGQPPQYVCVRYSVSLGCLRGEWRCPAPLQMHSDEKGQPRCVMPGH